MASTATLEGVYAKLARARFHARDLVARTDALVVGDGPVFRRELDGDPTKYVYWIDRVPVIDADLSATFGDFLTNLRASLDHLYFQLPVLENRKGSLKGNFPICEKKPTDEQGNTLPLRTGAIRNTNVRNALISVQPYSRSRPKADGLYVLNELVNTDKHRLLLVLEAALEFDGLYWFLEEGAPNPSHWLNGQPLHDGDPVARFDFLGHKPHSEFDPHFELHTRVDHSALHVNVMLRLMSLEKLLGWLYHWVEVEVLDRHFLTFFNQSPRVGTGQTA